MLMNNNDAQNDLWVFGYGSLMWRPGFDYIESRPARLFGYHRAFCVYSWYHRGSEEAPGLVLGLDQGGSCIGRAYRVPSHSSQDVIDYLDAREMVTAVYQPITAPIHTHSGKIVARSYIADRKHPQYAGKLPYDVQAEIIRHGVGNSGINTDYLASTVEHLDTLGIKDGPLHSVHELVFG
jgi:cation transport protein ChaC